MVGFLINGQPKKVPSTWNDITLGQAIDLVQWANDPKRSSNLVEMASILTGIEASKLNDQPAHKIQQLIIPMTDFMRHNELDAVKWKPPVQYVLNGVVYNREVDMGNVSMGCMDIFEKVMQQDGLKFVERIPLMIASISYKGKFQGRDQDARKDIENLANSAVMNMPLREAYPIACFFLRKYEISLLNQETNLKDMTNSKSGRVFRKWKNLVSSVRSILWREAMR